MKEKNPLEVLGFSTWSCLITDSKLSNEEAEEIKNYFNTDPKESKISPILEILKNKHSYKDFILEGNIAQTPFDNIEAGLYGFYSESSESEIKSIEKKLEPFFRRLRLGRLQEKSVNSSLVETTWIRPFLCTAKNLKITSSSKVNTGSHDIPKLLKIKEEVEKVDREIAETTLDLIYKEKFGIKTHPYKWDIIVIYEIPEFKNIGDLPVQSEEELTDNKLAAEFKRKVLAKLKKAFRDKYKDYLSLLLNLEHPDEKEVSIDNVSIYPIPNRESPSILAIYSNGKNEEKMYGITASAPWKNCMRNLVNNTLAIE